MKKAVLSIPKPPDGVAVIATLASPLWRRFGPASKPACAIMNHKPSLRYPRRKVICGIMEMAVRGRGPGRLVHQIRHSSYGIHPGASLEFTLNPSVKSQQHASLPTLIDFKRLENNFSEAFQTNGNTVMRHLARRMSSSLVVQTCQIV